MARRVGARVASRKAIGKAVQQVVHPLSLGMCREEVRQGVYVDGSGGRGRCALQVWMWDVRAWCVGRRGLWDMPGGWGGGVRGCRGGGVRG